MLVVLTTLLTHTCVRAFHRGFASPRVLMSSLSSIRDPISPTIVKPLLISLEGNIGAGKSTLLSHLKVKKPSWVFIDEPLNFWTSVVNDDGKNLLETFYSDCKRWSFTFQACALLSRFKNIENQISGHLRCNAGVSTASGAQFSLRQQFDAPVIDSFSSQPTSTLTGSSENARVFITERSLNTDFEVFTKMLVAAGHINTMELAVYRDWYEMLLQASTPLSAVVYLNESPQLCLNRIKKRGRKGEDSISLAYLQQLHSTLDSWLSGATFPVLEISENRLETVLKGANDDEGCFNIRSSHLIDDSKENPSEMNLTNEALANRIVTFVDSLR